MRSGAPNYRHGRWCLLALASVLLLSPGANAEAAAPFEFSAPACGSRVQFIRAVRERLPPNEQATVEQRLDVAVAAVQIDLAQGRGQVVFRSGEGAAARRTSGTNCADLVTSLALICAIAVRTEGGPVEVPDAGSNGDAAPSVAPPIAPDREQSPKSSHSEPLHPKSPENTVPAADTGVGSRAEAPVTRTPTALAESKRGAVAGASKSAEPARNFEVDSSRVSGNEFGVALGAGARVDGWTGPDNPLGVALWAALQPRHAAWSLRASTLWMESRASSDGRGARFRLFELRTEGCGSALGGRGRLNLDACLAVGAGAMFAGGLEDSGLLTAASKTVPWLDGALLLRAATPTVWGIRFEAQAELGSALVNHDFEFEAPSTRVFRAAPSLAPGLGVGVLIPLGT